MSQSTAVTTNKIIYDINGPSPSLFVQLAKPTVAETLAMAKELEKSINKLIPRYADHRGNLDEAMRCIADIISDLEGHQRDISEGKE